MPVSIVFQNLEAGASIEGIMEWFRLTREQIVQVTAFAARSLEVPSQVLGATTKRTDAHPL